jgi:hypothetical protein
MYLRKLNLQWVYNAPKVLIAFISVITSATASRTSVTPVTSDKNC